MLAARSSALGSEQTRGCPIQPFFGWVGISVGPPLIPAIAGCPILSPGFGERVGEKGSAPPWRPVSPAEAGSGVNITSLPRTPLPTPIRAKAARIGDPGLLRPGLTPSPPLRGSSIRNSRAEPSGPVRLCQAPHSFAGFECVGSRVGQATWTPTHSKSRNEWNTRQSSDSQDINNLS
jgi:hypothetical protein